MQQQNTKNQILVVLPTLGDRLATLRQTLESIDEQRTDVSLTLVVVAPAGALEARKLAKQFGAKIVDDPKTGISAAINCGLAARSGEEYYAWMGDDDLFKPGGLAKLLSLMKSLKKPIVAYGGCEYIDPSGKVLAVSNAGKLAQLILQWGPDLIPHPGSMINLDSLDEISGFDVTLKYAMDLDVFLKLKKLGSFASTRETVSAFRWHPDSLTVANRSQSSAESEKVKASHLPAIMKPFSFLWVIPVRWASQYAAWRISHKSLSLDYS